MALKLDISKAYDRIEWNFLEQMMRKLGFIKAWIQLVMMYVTTITYSLKLNGDPVGYIHPKRGIRHGIPFHPSFFSFMLRDYQPCLRHGKDRDELKV